MCVCVCVRDGMGHHRLMMRGGHGQQNSYLTVIDLEPLAAQSRSYNCYYNNTCMCITITCILFIPGHSHNMYVVELHK